MDPITRASLEQEIGVEIEGENFTVAVEAAGVDLQELTNVQPGTVIEVPVSYAQLQNAATEFDLGEVSDTEREQQDVEPDLSDAEDPDDPDFDPDSDADDDPDFNPEDGEDPVPAPKKAGRPPKVRAEARSIEVEKCSICGKTVVDLAMHIVNVHTIDPQEKSKPVAAKSEPIKRAASPVQSPFGLKPRKRAYCKGKYQQIKPVLRYPCDACKHVSKTSEQLKKHMIVAHNGHKFTSWMFCGECEYATRVEEELVNHVKYHQLFSILGDDKDDDIPMEEPEEPEPIKKSKTGLGNYDETPMNCGDCAFETHYENELFEHLKMHLRKDANITIDTESEEKVKKEEIEHSVEQRTIYEEDDCLHCGLCTFSSKSKKNMLRHSNIVHGVVINDKDYQGGTTITVRQSAYHCTLCKFKGTTREELAQHRKRTIHNKYGGVTAVDPIAEAEERKARIKNNCL